MVSAESTGFQRVRAKLEFDMPIVTLSRHKQLQSTISYGRELARPQN
jgi:hypothetical protein